MTDREDDTVTTDYSAPSARDAAEAALRLAYALAHAEDQEWKPSPRPRIWEADRTAGGGDGRPANPTLEVTMDARRLRVRLAVIAAWRKAEEARRDLERALETWNGERRLDDA